MKKGKRFYIIEERWVPDAGKPERWYLDFKSFTFSKSIAEKRIKELKSIELYGWSGDYQYRIRTGRLDPI